MAPPITVLSVRGTGEHPGANLLKNVTKQLDPARFRVIEVAYPATIGPVGGRPGDPSEMESVRRGVSELERHTAEAPGKVVTIGFSLGGVLTTEHLSRTDNPNNRKVVMSGNIANPRRRAGKSYGLPSFGEGIFGRPINDPRQWAEIANPGDVMTSMPADSPLRLGSDLIQWMSLSDPLRWATDVIAKLPAVQAQLLGADGRRLFDPRFWQSFPEAINLLNGYARGGTHTTAYFQPMWRDWKGRPISGIDLLARCVNGVKA